MIPVRLHVEDIRSKPDVFRMTRARVAAARRLEEALGVASTVTFAEGMAEFVTAPLR